VFESYKPFNGQGGVTTYAVHCTVATALMHARPQPDSTVRTDSTEPWGQVQFLDRSLHGKNGFGTATKLATTNKFLLLQPKILLQQTFC